MLDTNVLMHDPTSLFRFEEHDVFLPIGTLEELDNHKKGLSDVARNARQASRFLDEIVSGLGRPTSRPASRSARATARPRAGGCTCRPRRSTASCRATLAAGKTDNQILSVVRHLQEQYPQRPVVLVSKDINMRIKARALGLAAEDYFNDKVLEDTDLLYTGVRELPADFWDSHGRDMESWKKEGHTYYRVRGPLVPQAAAERVRLRRLRRAAAVRDGARAHRARGGAGDGAATTRTPRTPCGASRRATASRTSRSTC